MWEAILKFLTAVPLWELGLILLSRVIEVSMGTLRIILINKGYRRQGVVLAFFEVLIWVFVASRVISGIAEEPIKGIIYSFGFAIGVYLGSILEGRLAFGKVLVQAITNVEVGVVIANTLRSEGYGVTTVNAQGKDSDKIVLMIFANRRGKEQIIEKIRNIDSSAMIVSNDVSTLHGGHITSWRRFTK